MLDQDEAHPAVDRHVREERLEGVDATRRSADAHDQMGSVRRRGISRLCAWAGISCSRAFAWLGTTLAPTAWA